MLNREETISAHLLVNCPQQPLTMTVSSNFIFTNDFSYPEAVPAPLQFHRHQRRRQVHASCNSNLSTPTATATINTMSKPQISHCNALSRLPPQPILGYSEHQMSLDFAAPRYTKLNQLRIPGPPLAPTHQQLASCKCRQMPTSPLAPQVDLSRSPYAANRNCDITPVGASPSASLDFSALFMKAPGIRARLENCACNWNRTF
ncbi:hypothetical protein BD289DRAFT_430105 [Coniella lustricola]|uniref:Uncharacterized protein n=1 Tax=Coniella lustricola TaxID=2025994 RepID=A0A2T3ACA3_9PEZI|nr:hypothetical protein BD289DRAFT_430105 [Coniella lustricola]